MDVYQEQPPRARQLRATGGTDEQACAELLLQFLDSARERRLIDMQPLGSSGEVELFGHGLKAA